VVVPLDVEPAKPDGEQPVPGGVGVQLALDVGGVDDLGQAGQGGVSAQVVVLDQDLEGAEAVAVVVAGAGSVEAVGPLCGGDVEHLLLGHVEDLGARVDEAPDEPRAGDPVGLGTGTGNPFHDGPPVGSMAVSASAP
jgi:hypothetical protein